MGLLNGLAGSFKIMGQLNRECRLYFVGIGMNGISQGIFMVVFNLYILSMGISTETLGGILSAGPFAQALGSVPIGFLMESIGFKTTFVVIYGVSSIAKLLQVITPSVPLMAVAAFTSGLALSGDFVVRLPFLAANTTPEQRTHVYSLSSIIYSVTIAVGSLLAGFIPSLFQAMGFSETGAYQFLLVLAALISLIGTLPFLLLKTTQPAMARSQISLAPYLWGIDRFTVQQAVTSLFVGLCIGLTGPFMNIYFLFHLGTTREYFGVVSALSILPTMLVTAVGPILAQRTGAVRAVTWLRVAIPLFTLDLALTAAAWSGSISYWMISSLNSSAQPLSFAFAMRATRKSAQAAVASWLNVTFWLGMAIAAPVAGFFLASANYLAPLLIAGGAILVAGILNDVFFYRMEAKTIAVEQNTGQ
jgi:MFS family permease